MWNAHEAGARWGRKIAARGPVATGLLGLGAGLALLGLDALVRWTVERTLTVACMIGGLSVPTGLWTLATRRSAKSADNPVWWTVGYYTAAILGGGLGLGYGLGWLP